jgi:hypothetical protein
MKKTKKLLLSRETVRSLVAPAELREAAGGLTTLITKCLPSGCVTFCKAC